MELIKATIKNYRIHKEMVVNFGPELTLIGGENEKGKSTIAEAIHRALFLKASGETEIHNSMKSTKHLGGDPEVELVFKSQGKVFTLTKKFSSKGSVSLSEPSMITLTGDEAEKMLSEVIIQTPTGISGKSFKGSNKWSLLWVWQNKSGENPVGFIGENHDKLINRLQSFGAAALMSSAYDIEVADKFSKLNEKNFVTNGGFKTKSAVKDAEDNLKNKQIQYESAKKIVEGLVDSAERYESVKLQFDGQQKANTLLKTQVLDLEKRINLIGGLEKDKNAQSLKYKSTELIYKELVQTQNDIESLEEDIKLLTDKLEPSNKTLSDKKQKFSESQDAYREQSIKLGDLRDLELSNKNTIELCNIYKNLTANKKVLSDLIKVKGQADDYRAKIKEQEGELNKLLKVTRADVDGLDEIKRSLDVAKATLSAISTTIEVLNSKDDVLVDGKKQLIGEKVNLAEKFEIKVGENTFISITPGGGSSLIKAKDNYEALKSSFSNGISSLGFNTLEDAANTLNSRNAIELKIDNLRALLSNLNAEDIETTINNLEGDILSNTTSLQQKANAYGINIENYTEDSVLETLQNSENSLVEIGNNIEIVKGVAGKLSSEIEVLNKLIIDLENEIKVDVDGLSSNQTTLNYIINKNVDKQTLSSKLKEAEAQKNIELNALNNISIALNELSPDNVTDEKNRFEQALKESVTTLAELNQELIGLKLKLTLNGTDNPNENLSKAEAGLYIAKDLFNAELKKAKAIQLLDKCFTEEQQELADKLTLPLANKIKEYLKPIFGTTIKVTIRQEGGEFKEFMLSRDGKEGYSFDSLSGGTREQFSAAVRLAMADILSENFDKKLPVVFDDAFANSDSKRIVNIQPMLYLASKNGIQVIVLTCHPELYVPLGAKQVLLN